MGFKSALGKAFSSAKKYMGKKWDGAVSKVSSALFGRDEDRITEDTAISGPADIEAEEAKATIRGILNTRAVRNVSHYDEIKDKPEVLGLMSEIEDFETVMQGLHVPYFTGDETSFLKQVSTNNGDAITTLMNMRNQLKDYGKLFMDKKGKKYEGVMSLCIIYTTRIDSEIDYINKIQERLMYAIRSQNYKAIPSGASYESLLNKMDYVSLFEESEGDKETVGTGGMNSVYKVWDKERNANRVFKQGEEEWDLSKNSTQKEVYGRLKGVNNASLSGVNKVNSANRDVAVSIIDKLFRLDAAVDTSMAKSSSGKKSSVMDFAKGATGNDAFFYGGNRDKKDIEFLNQLRKFNDEQESARFMDAAKKSDDAARKKRFVELADEKKKKIAGREKNVYVNANSAEFLESTYNLAALDIIVGHVDRHSGNIMATEHGVKGIDNDTAFSLRTASGLSAEYNENGVTDFSKIKKKEIKRGAMMNGATVQNESQAILFFDTAFPKAPKSFIDKICAVDTSSVEGALKGLLEPDEIEACVGRVKELQNYLSKLPDSKIVGSFEDIDRDEYAGMNYNGAQGNIYAQLLNGEQSGIIDRNDGVDFNNYRYHGSANGLASMFEKRFGWNRGLACKVGREALNEMLQDNRKQDIDVEGIINSTGIDEYIYRGAIKLQDTVNSAYELSEIYHILGKETGNDFNTRVEANKKAADDLEAERTRRLKIYNGEIAG